MAPRTRKWWGVGVTAVLLLAAAGCGEKPRQRALPLAATAGVASRAGAPVERTTPNAPDSPLDTVARQVGGDPTTTTPAVRETTVATAAVVAAVPQTTVKPAPVATATTTTTTTTLVTRTDRSARLAVATNPFARNADQCTWYAEERMKQHTGLYMAVDGDAWQWAERAAASGWTVGTQPEANAVVVLPAGSYSSAVGHVAWVLDVAGDQVRVQDYNWNAAGARVTDHWLAIVAGTRFIYGDR